MSNATKKVRQMRKKTQRLDQHKEDRENDGKIIEALTDMGSKVSEALAVLGSSEKSQAAVFAAEEATKKREAAFQAMSTRIDGLKETVNRSSAETQDMLRLILSRLPPRSISIYSWGGTMQTFTCLIPVKAGVNIAK